MARYSVSLLLLLPLLIAPGPARVIVEGDSLSECIYDRGEPRGPCWPTILRLESGHPTIHNLSRGASRMFDWERSVTPRAILQAPLRGGPIWAVTFLGTNDSNRNAFRVALEAFSIIERHRTEGISRTILVTPPARTGRPHQRQGLRDIGVWLRAIAAQEDDVDLVDLTELDPVYATPGSPHLTVEGQRVVAELIGEALR